MNFPGNSGEQRDEFAVGEEEVGRGSEKGKDGRWLEFPQGIWEHLDEFMGGKEEKRRMITC